jgi:dihydrofolate synthase / folylpolyglutamate synthase
MSVEPILSRLTALYPVAIDLSLDRMRRLLDDLGRPQDAFAPVIHVAGTNGKGSTVAFLRAFFEAAGYRAHVYTSPHLVRFNERIRVAGRLIEDQPLTAILEEVERVNAGRPITFFEVTTAAAFLAFARAPADVVLLEVGMGGRTDATNVVARPAACALTPISFDHMSYLGDTLAKIAGEKAEIIKPNVPVAIGPQPRDAMAVFTARAAALGAPVHAHDAGWTAAVSGERVRYRGRAAHDLPPPALPGRHQIDNSGLAIAVTEIVQGFAITPAHLATGMRTVEWPARLQRLARGRLADLLPAGWDLFLDGGHNEGAGVVLADWAAMQVDGKPLDLIWGMLNTKDPAKVLALLRPHVRRLRAIAIPGDRLSLSAHDVAASARAAGIADVRPMQDVAAAIADLAQGAGPARILIAGSLHLAGAVLRENG